MARIVGTAICASLSSCGSSMCTGPVGSSAVDWLRRSTRRNIFLHQRTFLAGSNDGSWIDGMASVSVWIVGNGAVRDPPMGGGAWLFFGGWWGELVGGYGYDELEPCVGWGTGVHGDRSEPTGGARTDTGLLRTTKSGSAGWYCGWGAYRVV